MDTMHRDDVAELGEGSPLALQILDYLRRHPQAKDSVEGIAQFWVHADPIEVRRALDRLVDLKLVEKRSSASMDLYSGPVGEAALDESMASFVE
jgi:DNA-binding IclR family transcriptional regulator